MPIPLSAAPSRRTPPTRRRALLWAASACCGLGPVGPACAGPAALLAREWVSGTDPTGWLVSEKLDGVRALWDGRRLRFRSGREGSAPGWFLDRLPPQALDGELWLGRGRFEAVSGLVRRVRSDDAGWRELRYMVFELPDAAGGFAERADRLHAIAARVGWPALQAVPQQRLDDAVALDRRLAEVLRAGGEGLVLHRADAPYATGRSDALRKLKPLADAEAVVVGHQAGRGALQGQVGALRVRAADGRVFDIGSGLTRADHRQSPPIGTRITYTHRGLTASGLPRFASYLRVAPAF